MFVMTCHVRHDVPQHFVWSEDNIEATVNATCDLLDAAVDALAPPHIVLDATRSGIVSETVKSFTKALGLPTFSSSFGQKGDIR